jgi:hypothetical protein
MTTTSTSTPAAETAPTTAPVDDSALVADLESLLAGASEPTTSTPAPAAAPATPAPAPQDAEAIPPDLEAQLVAQAKGRQAERAAREPVVQMQAQIEQMRAELARAPGLTAIAAAVQAKDPAALASALRAANLDPDAVQQLATRAKLAPPQADVMASAIEQAVTKALERAGVVQQQQPQQQAPAPAGDPRAAIDAYSAYIEAAPERFPLQAAMGSYSGPAAIHFIRERLLGQGVPSVEVDALPYGHVAAMFEAHLAATRPRLSQPSGAQPASGEPVSQPPGAPSASGGPRSSATPTALTNGHAADVTRAAPRTKREIDLELERELDQMMRGA